MKHPTLMSAGNVAGKNNDSLTRRVYHEHSAVKQLKQVLKSVHQNHQVISTTISFTGADQQRMLIDLYIDGVKFEGQDLKSPIEKIQISRVFRFQPELFSTASQHTPHK